MTLLFFSSKGLVTLDEMKAKQEDVVKQREKQLAKKDAEARQYAKQQEEKRRYEKMKVCKRDYERKNRKFLLIFHRFL